MQAHPTPAELEVLHRLTEPGATIATVARELEITERAVTKRLTSLYRRLGVTSAAQAVWATRTDLGTLRD